MSVEAVLDALLRFLLQAGALVARTAPRHAAQYRATMLSLLAGTCAPETFVAELTAALPDPANTLPHGSDLPAILDDYLTRLRRPSRDARAISVPNPLDSAAVCAEGVLRASEENIDEILDLQATVNEKVLCQVCRDSRRTHALPCGHLLCASCSAGLCECNCPFCRQQFDRAEVRRLL